MSGQLNASLMAMAVMLVQLFCASSAEAADKIVNFGASRWHTDFNAGLKEANAKKKWLLVLISAEW